MDTQEGKNEISLAKLIRERESYIQRLHQENIDLRKDLHSWMERHMKLQLQLLDEQEKNKKLSKEIKSLEKL